MGQDLPTPLTSLNTINPKMFAKNEPYAQVADRFLSAIQECSSLAANITYLFLSTTS